MSACWLSDATESYFPEFKASTLKMVTAQSGIVGWVADSGGRGGCLCVIERFGDARR